MTHHPVRPPHYESYYHLAPPPPPLMPLRLPDYGYAANDRTEINTLFVSGLPDDVKAREIHNLFRRRPGFASCQLKYTGRANQVVAFATFVNHQSAMEALLSLDGAKFDPQTGSTLHIELAKSNSTRKNKPGSGPYVVIDRRTKSDTVAQNSSSDGGGSGSEDSPTHPDPAADQEESGEETSTENAADVKDATAPEHEEAEKRTDGACSTLFIANLGPNCTDEELKQLLSQYQGFNSIKVRARGGMPVAFADFERVEDATEAMNAIQGCSLPSSDRGGMHIEYARSKMRKP